MNVANGRLVPPQLWRIQTEATKTLGPLGTFTARLLYEDISDIVDQIPIAGGGQAPGNIDSAKRYGGDLNLTLLSEPLGWAGAKLDTTFRYRNSDVEDPLLGTIREIGDEERVYLYVELRQDLRNSAWAFGGDLEYFENTPDVRLDERLIFQNSFAGHGLFVENKDVFGLTVRANAFGLFDQKENLYRVIYADRLNDNVATVEDRRRGYGTVFRLDIEGSF